MPNLSHPSAKASAVGDRAWAIPSLREPRYSQSLERGLAILTCFSAHRPVLGIADIADELGMSRSTTHRYVVTLVALGYLEQGASRKYRLGLKVTDLGISAMNATGLREHAHSYLEELRQRTSCSAAIGVLDGDAVLLLDRVRSYRSPYGGRLRLQRGSRLPLHCSAAGKLLLAHLSEAELRPALAAAGPLRTRGPNAITSKRALRAELARVAERGFALDDEELAAGTVALSVPVHDDSGTVVAALTLSCDRAGTSAAQLAEQLLGQVQAAAAGISRRLGYLREARA